LTIAGGVPSYATPTTGTVTSVSGTGTVSGISLSGTVTSSGSLTLGGTLDLSAPPTIGNTTANTIRGTTITATTGFVGTNFDAAGSGGGALRTSGGSNCLQWGGGGGVNVTIDGPINMNGANAAIQINPTGTGTVSIAPAGALTVNPTTASTMNNVAIGGTTPLAGTFTDLRVNNTISLAGTTGTAGFVLTSNGASAPTWQANANGLTIADDTTTNATRYLTFTSATTGNITTANVASTKLQFNPSTGVFTTTGLNLSGLTASNAVATDASKNLVSVANTGTGNNVLATSPTLVTPILGTPTSGNLNNCTADGTNKVGYRNVPPVGNKNSSYTLAVGDVGEYVQVVSGGSITIPDATFAEGDIISIFNNTTGNITITCTITTAYIAGTDSDKASVTLATRGVATILFISSTVCVISGNVT
jgi:hypothetical protein